MISAFILATLLSEPSMSADLARGDFAKAKSMAMQTLRSAPQNVEANQVLGTTFLFENNLPAAKRHLGLAHKARPNDKKLLGMLAECSFREGNAAAAASYWRKRGDTVHAKQLEAIGTGRICEVKGHSRLVSIKFLQVDPLPILEVKVNGRIGNFILDTGAGDTILDPEFAEQLKLARYGSGEGTFGGGAKAKVEYGQAVRLELGGVQIQNAPTRILSTKRFAAVAGGRAVHGVMGIGILYRFCATLNYPAGQLDLRLPDTKVNAKSAVSIYHAGSHYVVAKGRVGNGKPHWFFIDTGLAGAGFAAPESTFKEAGIKVSGSSFEGQGGAGTVRVTPVNVSSLSLGDVSRKNLMGISGAFPPQLESGLGFPVGGLVSHQFFRSMKVTFDFRGQKLWLE